MAVKYKDLDLNETSIAEQFTTQWLPQLIEQANKKQERLADREWKEKLQADKILADKQDNLDNWYGGYVSAVSDANFETAEAFLNLMGKYTGAGNLSWSENYYDMRKSLENQEESYKKDSNAFRIFKTGTYEEKKKVWKDTFNNPDVTLHRKVQKDWDEFLSSEDFQKPEFIQFGNDLSNMGTQSFLQTFSPLVDLETFAANNNAKDYKAIVAKIQGSVSANPSSQYWYWDDNGKKVGLTNSSDDSKNIDKAIEDSFLPGFTVNAYQQWTGSPDNPRYNLSEVYESSPLSRDNVERVAIVIARAQASAGFGGEKFVDKESQEYKDAVNKNLSNLLRGPNNTYNNVVEGRVKSLNEKRLETVKAELESFVSGQRYITQRGKDKEAGFFRPKDDEATNKKISSLQTEINQIEKSLDLKVTDFTPEPGPEPGPTPTPTPTQTPTKKDWTAQELGRARTIVQAYNTPATRGQFTKEEVAEARELIAKNQTWLNEKWAKDKETKKQAREKKAWNDSGGPSFMIEAYNKKLSEGLNVTSLKGSVIAKIKRHNNTWGTNYSTDLKDHTFVVPGSNYGL